MELNIFKEKLNQGLNIIEHITRKNANLVVLNNVLLETEKSFLKLSATNLEISIIWWILSEIKREGKALIPASFLKSVIDFIKEEVIKLESEKGNLILKTENQEIQIQGINLDDFPIIPKIEIENSIKIRGEKLNQGLNQIVNIPSYSQIRPEISGIYFSFKKEEIKIAATDGFRLAEKVINLPQKINKDFSFILPQTTAKELINILSLRPNDLNIHYNVNQVLFEWLEEETSYPEIHFSSRLIGGEYLNYQEIIPKKYTTQIIINREEFQTQIKKAGLFSGKISTIKLNIIPQKNQLKIFSQSPDIGKTEIYLPIKIEKKIEQEIEMSFNYKFLLDGLNNIKSSEIIFGISEGEGPVTIKPVGDESYVYVLMPTKNI
ncbi:DNA polymerase III subunit beta [Patescibacteria group bacterium]|nr:DNA polymerase III subunit beta [Patescibacteria group bacterium]